VTGPADDRDARARPEALRAELLAGVGHELRTPLSGVLGALGLLAETPLTPEQRRYLDLARASAQGLLALVDDVLALARIDAGKVELERLPFSLRGLVAETLKPFAVRAAAKGLALAPDVLPDVPDALVGDPTRLRQVLVNLVGNAVKFTDRGEVVVRVEVESRSAQEVTLHLAVRDTGVGIPEHRRQAIFEAFTQAAGSTERTHGGSGLGLAIASRLVALMGGRIWVDSEVGRGSVFHVVVPAGVQEERRDRGEAGFAGLSALVAEPNASLRRAVAETLRGWSLRVLEAETGQEAVEALADAAARGDSLGFVLLAIDLPGLDAVTVAERVRGTPGLAARLILMTRPLGRRGDRERWDAIGPDAVLTRPVDDASLRAALVGPGGAAAPPRRRPASRPLHVLLAEDNSVNSAVAAGLLETWGHRVTIAEDGKTALSAFEGGRFDLVVLDVHMPGLDGLDVARAIRRREVERGSRVPILAVTARALPGDRERCLDAGMDEYLAKPVTAEALFAAVERLTAAGGPAADPPPAVDVAALRQRLGDDRALERRIVGVFLEHGPAMLDRVREAVGHGDARALADAAHTLAGALANFGAEAAEASARRLETMGRSGDLSGAAAACAELAAELERLRTALAPLAD